MEFSFISPAKSRLVNQLAEMVTFVFTHAVLHFAGLLEQITAR